MPGRTNGTGAGNVALTPVTPRTRFVWPARDRDAERKNPCSPHPYLVQQTGRSNGVPDTVLTDTPIWDAATTRAQAEGASLAALMRAAVERYATGKLTSQAEPISGTHRRSRIPPGLCQSSFSRCSALASSAGVWVIPRSHLSMIACQSPKSAHHFGGWRSM